MHHVTNLYFLLLSSQVVLGLHIVRGDNIAVVGELDEEVDRRLDLANMKAEPIPSLVR